MFGENLGHNVRFRPLGIVLFVLCLLALSAADPGLGVEIADIPKPQRWVTDLTGSIPAEAIAAVERTADRIERENGGQLAVVVVGSLDGKEPRPFAKDLFNAWRIGRAEQDDGVLIFVALAEHRAEILLGSGIDDPDRQRASDEIMQQVMVPQFKAGNPGEALVQGVEECARRIYGLAAPIPSAAESSTATAVPVPRPLAAPTPVYPTSGPGPVRDDTGGFWGPVTWFWLGVLCVFLVVWVLRKGWLGPRGRNSFATPMVQLDDSTPLLADTTNDSYDSSISSSFSSSSGSDSGSSSFGGGSTSDGGSSGHW